MSRRRDSPVHSFPKPSSVPPIDNNVLPQYEKTFGSPEWLAETQVCSIVQEAEQMYVGQSIAKIATLQEGNTVGSENCLRVSLFRFKTFIL